MITNQFVLTPIHATERTHPVLIDNEQCWLTDHTTWPSGRTMELIAHCRKLRYVFTPDGVEWTKHTHYWLLTKYGTIVALCRDKSLDSLIDTYWLTLTCTGEL